MADRTLRIDIDVNETGAVSAVRRVDDALDQVKAAAQSASPYIDQINRAVERFGGAKLTTEARATAQAVYELGGASKLTANEQVRVNALMTEAAAKYRALGQAVPGIVTDMQKATGGVAALGTTTQTTSRFVSGLTSMVMRFAGPLAIGMAIRRTLDWADSIEEMSQATGIGIEQLQRIRYAADQSGLGFDRMIQGIGQLQDRIGSGDKGAIAALAKFGLESRAFAALKTDDQILALAEGFGKLDQAAQVPAMKDLFGRAGQYWIPVLQDYKKKLAEAVVQTEANVRALAALNDLWARAKDTGLVLVATVLVPMASLMRDMSEGKVSAGTAGFWGTFFKLAPSIGPSAAWTQAQTVSDLMAQAAGIPPPRNADILLGKESATPAQRAVVDVIDKLADDLWGDTAIAHARAMIAAVEKRGAVEDLSAKAQDRLRKALEDAAEAAGTRFPRELRKFQESIVLASSAIQMSQLTKAPISVEGWPGLTEWAKAQPGLESTDLSGMLYNLPGAYLGNMQAGQLIVKRQTEDFAKIFNASLDDLSRAFAELAQVADGDMAKAVRAIGTVISTMRIASQAAESTRGILWNAETGTWQAPQGAGQYAQLAANTVAMYAAMQQATGSTSRAQNIWGGAGTGAQIGGGIVPGWGHAIGAGVGALWGGLSRAPEQAAKDLRDAFVGAAGGLAALNAKAAAAGITLQGLLSQTDVAGVQWHIDDINKRLGEFAARLQAAVVPLQRITAKGGLLGAFEIAELVRLQGEKDIRAALETFFISETQRGIKGLTQWTAALRLDELRAAREAVTVAESRGVLTEIEAAHAKLAEVQAMITRGVSAASAPGWTGAVLAYWQSLEAQGLNLVEILDVLGPQITAIQEAFALAGVSGGAAFEALARVVTATADPAVRTVLEAVTGINTVLETLFNTGQLTQEIFGGLIAGVSEQYEELMRLGKGPEEARRLVRQPLQTIWQLQQTYKFTVDEGTQRLLTDALAAGEVGEAFKPAADRMVTAIDQLIAKLQGFIDVLLGVSGADEPPPTPPELPPKIAPREPSPWYREPWPEPPPYEGHWGGWVTPQGIKRWHTGGLASDEVPAILQTGELIWSRAQVRQAQQASASLRSDRPLAPIHITVESRLDGRKVARNQIRLLPDALGRYGEA